MLHCVCLRSVVGTVVGAVIQHDRPPPAYRSWQPSRGGFAGCSTASCEIAHPFSPNFPYRERGRPTLCATVRCGWAVVQYHRLPTARPPTQQSHSRYPDRGNAALAQPVVRSCRLEAAERQGTCLLQMLCSACPTCRRVVNPHPCPTGFSNGQSITWALDHLPTHRQPESVCQGTPSSAARHTLQS